MNGNCRIESLFGGEIDLDDFGPIIEHHRFKKLGCKKQLGTVFMVFPGATHTRLAHSAGTMDIGRYFLARGGGRRWARDDVTLRSILVAKLLHDVGHPGFSHQLEDELVGNHNDYLKQILPELRRAIEHCHADYALVSAILGDKQHPLTTFCKHPVLGSDLLDYLIRDAKYTIGGSRLDLVQLLRETEYVDGQLIANLSIIDEVVRALFEYIYMYKNVYREPRCQAVQRFFQKMVRFLIRSGELTEAIAWELVDDEIMSRIMNSSQPLVRRLHKRLLEGRVPQPAIVIRVAGFGHEELIDDDPKRVFEVSPDEFERLMVFDDRKTNEDAEEHIAHEVGVPPESVSLIPVVDTKRFKKRDILVGDRGGKTMLLSERRPRQYAAIDEMTDAYRAVRVSFYKEDCEAAACRPTADRIFDYLMRTAEQHAP